MTLINFIFEDDRSNINDVIAARYAIGSFTFLLFLSQGCSKIKT